MKRTMAVTVRGKHSEWSFTFRGDPRHLEDWLGDGLDVFIVEGCIPLWVQQLGLTRPWFAVQSFWQWVRLW